MESENAVPTSNAATHTPEQGHILVVDDYPMNRLKLVRLLQQQGHTVAQAGDGEQALAMLREQPFDVVLLDLLMPQTPEPSESDRCSGRSLSMPMACAVFAIAGGPTSLATRIATVLIDFASA